MGVMGLVSSLRFPYFLGLIYEGSTPSTSTYDKNKRALLVVQRTANNKIKQYTR